MSWFHAAHTVGIPLSLMHISSSEPPDPLSFQVHKGLLGVTFMDGKIISPSDTIADEYTMKLAKETNVEFLTSFYKHDSSNNFRFTRAQTIPDIKDQNTAQSLGGYFDFKLS
jgi:hypothetical protein